MSRALPAPFARFVAPAQARAQVWRLVLGLGVIVACHGLLLVALAGVLRLTQGRTGAAETLASLARGGSPGAVVAVLASFAGIALGTVLAVRLVHGRRAGTLVGRGSVALRHFALGAGLLVAVFVLAAPVIWLVAWAVPGLAAPTLLPGVPAGVWLVWLMPALVALLVQTGAEELVFRGYLQQQLAARFASPLVWAVLPSVGFGLLHFDPVGMGANAWLVVGATGLFGLVAADLTARSGTLGLAWGLHFANNFVALALVAPSGDLSGLALWRAPFATDDTGLMRLALVIDMLALGVVWALARAWLARSGDTG